MRRGAMPVITHLTPHLAGLASFNTKKFVIVILLGLSVRVTYLETVILGLCKPLIQISTTTKRVANPFWMDSAKIYHNYPTTSCKDIYVQGNLDKRPCLSHICQECLLSWMSTSIHP